MNRKLRSLFMVIVAGIAVSVFQSGCEDGMFGSEGGGGSASVDVNGFYEGTAPNGTTAAATFIQSGSSVTGPEVKINRRGSLTGTLDGVHFTFTVNFYDGTSASGEGNFTADGMNFAGTLSSAGAFTLSWRGPDFDHHTPLGQPLGYKK